MSQYFLITWNGWVKNYSKLFNTSRCKNLEMKTEILVYLFIFIFWSQTHMSSAFSKKQKNWLCHSNTVREDCIELVFSIFSGIWQCLETIQDKIFCQSCECHHWEEQNASDEQNAYSWLYCFKRTAMCDEAKAM